MIPTKIIDIDVPKTSEKDVVLDNKGFFVINVDHKIKSIIVEYYERVDSKTNTPKGGILKFIFKGKKAQDLYRTILKHDLISMLDHSAYIGSELAKAEICLRTGKKYVQDGELN